MSFFSAELYCSSERKGSPLGNVSSGDLVAISHTPSYHSSGQRPEDLPETKNFSICIIQVNVRKVCNMKKGKTAKLLTEPTRALHCKSHDDRVEPKVPEELL